MRIQPLPSEVKVVVAGIIFAAFLTYFITHHCATGIYFAAGIRGQLLREGSKLRKCAYIVAHILSTSDTLMRSTVRIPRVGRRKCFLLTRPKRRHTLPTCGVKKQWFDSILRIQNAPVSTKHRATLRMITSEVRHT